MANKAAEEGSGTDDGLKMAGVDPGLEPNEGAEVRKPK